jgi:hypothetical protein
MKTFKDLEFKKHPSYGIGGFRTQAEMKFDNNYGVSVITGGYGNESKPYEVAVLYRGGLCYTTHLTASEVTKIMEQVQELNESVNA